MATKKPLPATTDNGNILHGQGKLFLIKSQMLYVDSFFKLLPSLNRFLNKSLSASKLTDDTCLLKFPLEFFQSSLNVLTLFNWNYNHLKPPPFYLDRKSIYFFLTLQIKSRYA